MPFAFRDLYGLKQVYKHTFDEQSMYRKNFEVAASHQGRSQIFNFEVKFAYNSLKNLEDGYGTEKSPFAYVCDHKNCFTRHMTIPVVLRDCYDPKQTCKHTWHGHKLRKKSFRVAGSRNRCTQNCTF